MFFILLILSGIVFAGRAGLVVQLSNSSVITKCVEFKDGGSAFDLLQSSGLSVATKDYGGELGVAVCKMLNVGCEADNCFCQSEYWNFNYIEGGGWVYAPVGISGYMMKDGDVLGFRWGVWGDKPELHLFSEICPSSTQQSGGGRPIRYFGIEVNANCSEEQVVIDAKEKGGGAVWEPTSFFSTEKGLDITVENGVGVRVLMHVTQAGRDAGFEKIAFLFTDREGKADFTPQRSGVYRLEFEKDGFLREEREIKIGECRKEIVITNQPVEMFGSRNEELETNITRVQIIAPESALMNSTVVVRMLSTEGKPLVYESIIVEFPGGRKELITNESGEATFSAEEKGVYSYSSPKHLLSSFEVTNVIEPGKISLESPQAPQAPPAEAPPSVGMATAGTSPVILVAGAIIILALLYLLREVRK